MKGNLELQNGITVSRSPSPRSIKQGKKIARTSIDVLEYFPLLKKNDLLIKKDNLK